MDDRSGGVLTLFLEFDMNLSIGRKEVLISVERKRKMGIEQIIGVLKAA